MEGARDSKEVVEEKQDQEVVGEQDKEKKMEEELEMKAKRMQEKREGKKEMEVDNAKEMEDELEKKAKRMQEKKEGKKEIEEDNVKELEEELEKKAKRLQEIKKGKKEIEEDNAMELEEVLEKKAKRLQEIKKGKKKVEEEEELEWEWEVEEGQEVALIKNQEADNNNNNIIVKKKSFMSKLKEMSFVSKLKETSFVSKLKEKSFVLKLVPRLSRKEEPIIDDDPLTERLIKLEMQRELRWWVRRIFSNGGNTAPWASKSHRAFAFDKALEALHSLKVHIFKEQVLPYYVTDSLTRMTLAESSASIAELQKEFHTQMKRILSEEGDTDLNAYEHAFKLLSTIKYHQDSNTQEEEYEQQHLQDSVPLLCGICQNLMTESVPFDEQIALDVPDEYAKDFHRACLNSWLQQLQSTNLPRANDDPLSCKTIIFKMISGWKNQPEIYETRNPETTRDEIFSFNKKNEDRFNKIIKKISSTDIAKREEGISELNKIHQNIQVVTEFKGFLCHNPVVIPELLCFLVATATSLNAEVQDDIITAVLHACNKKTNKKWIGKDPFIIPHLIIVLESELAVRIKVKCAAALTTLSDESSLNYNNIKIGELGAIRQLAKFLEESHKEAKKAAALAIVSMCMAPENHHKALEANMVDMAVRLIVQKIVVEEALMTLWLLRNSRPAMTALASHEMVEQCLSIVLRNPSNPIQPESIEVACHVLIQRDQGEYYQICQKIVAVFRKSLGSTDSQREENILWWLKFSTNTRNGETTLCDEVLNNWWNLIM